MKIFSSLEGATSAFAGQALDGWAVSRSAKQWGIFKRERDSVPQKDVTVKATPSYKMVRILGASHIETLGFYKSNTISSAPQEDGAFLSYNKVKNPYHVTLRMICDGSDSGHIWENILPGRVRTLMGRGFDDTKKAFIKELDTIVDDTHLYHIKTPEKLYSNANIISYRFHRAPDISSTILMVDLIIQEVRNATSTGWKTTRTPAGAQKHYNGTVQSYAFTTS